MVSTTDKTVKALVLRACVASDLMAPDPISIRSEASAADALLLFTEKGIHAAPVIDQAGRPIGVLSQSDLLVHQVEATKHRSTPEYYFEPDEDAEETAPDVKNAGATTVTALMTPAVFAVAPDTPMYRVVSDMIGLRVHRLFVVDGDGVLIGVISTMDVLKALTPE
jgi:CBS-domain-containing membrane protein